MRFAQRRVELEHLSKYGELHVSAHSRDPSQDIRNTLEFILVIGDPAGTAAPPDHEEPLCQQPTNPLTP